MTVKSTATSAPAAASASAVRADLDRPASDAELADVDADVVRVDRRDELEAGVVADGLADRHSHPAARAEHADS